jgi:eukaryotic-like serine/threonine-protein kinase
LAVDHEPQKPRAGSFQETTEVIHRKGPGTVLPGSILGSYRLIEQLGEGAVGRVFLAEHLKLGRKVALKVLRDEYSKNPKVVARFFTEARAVNDIHHENIVAITDFAEANDDHPSFYIMELLHGQTLSERMMKEGKLPIPAAIDVAVQLARALGAVHERGLVHRDVKPANVFLVNEEIRPKVKLLDFGVAKLLRGHTDEGPQAHQTLQGDLIGTPDYMSPEQTYGASIDHRADVYALGLVMYEMVTGTQPFDALSLEELFEQHRAHPPTPPSTRVGAETEIPSELEALIMRCLAKKPDDRPGSALEIERTLSAIADQEGIELTQSRRMSSIAQAEPRRSHAAPIAVAAVIAVGAAGLFLVDRLTKEAPTVPTAPAITPASDPPIMPLAAPEPPPPPPPPPVVERTEVTLTIESRPPKAAAYLGGKLIGTTPIHVDVKKQRAPIVLELKLQGHESYKHQLKLENDLTLNASLTAIPPPQPKKKPAVVAKKKRAARTKEAPVTASETRNPFGEE